MADGVFTKAGMKNNDNFDNHLKLNKFSLNVVDISAIDNSIFQISKLCGNRSKVNIHRCKSKTSKLKDNFTGKGSFLQLLKGFTIVGYNLVLSV